MTSLELFQLSIIIYLLNGIAFASYIVYQLKKEGKTTYTSWDKFVIVTMVLVWPWAVWFFMIRK